jgi:hypothetical protein
MMPIALYDSVTGRIFSNKNACIHSDLIIEAERELNLQTRTNGRFVCGYLQNGGFVTGLRLKHF